MNFLPAYQSLSLGEVKSKISKLANIGKPEQDFLFTNITDWQNSPEREYMLIAQNYYGNDNDITERVRYYIDRNGSKQEAQNLSNSKLAHPYMRKLTNQKVNYLLSKEFTVDCEDKMFVDALGKYIDKKFRRKLKRIGVDSIVNGIAWVQVHYNQEGVLCFKRIPSEEIIPFWADADHTELDAVIRVYSITQIGETGYKKELYKVEYHTVNGVWYYVLGDKGLEPDPEMGGTAHGHFFVQEQDGENVDENGQPVMRNVEATWDKVPFIPFKYNADEMSLLKLIKPILDDYDTNTSDTSNNLQDVPNSIKVVRNYDGTDKGEFVQNLAIYRTAFVSDDGDLSALNTPLDTSAIDSHLNRLKRDLYEAGNGVDTQDDNLGDASGVALRFRYSGLDMDVDNMSNEFCASMEELVWFIKVDLAAKGLGDYMDTDFNIVFNTDMIVNETETIQNAKASVGIISDETIIANHPWVIDAQAEAEKMQKQKEQAMQELMTMQGNENGFGEPAPNNGGDE